MHKFFSTLLKFPKHISLKIAKQKMKRDGGEVKCEWTLNQPTSVSPSNLLEMQTLKLYLETLQWGSGDCSFSQDFQVILMYSSLRTTTIEEIYNTYQPTEIWLSNIWSRLKKKCKKI